MKSKELFFICSLLLLGTTVYGQRVIRKGTTPIKMKKTSAPRKSNFAMEQVQGKWQEYGRVDIATHKKLAYTDTLMLVIVKDKVEVKEGMSMDMKGDADIEGGSILTVAEDSYSIVSIAGTQMILKDWDVLKTMRRVKFFYLETVGKDSIKQTDNNIPKNILLADIMGKWMVYKKEAKPGVINDETELVYSLAVLKDSTQNIATGEIVMNINNMQQKFACIFILKDSTMQVLANNKTWSFNTYRADKSEFVFGKQNEVKHYAKRF